MVKRSQKMQLKRELALVILSTILGVFGGIVGNILQDYAKMTAYYNIFALFAFGGLIYLIYWIVKEINSL